MHVWINKAAYDISLKYSLFSELVANFRIFVT